MTAAKPGAQHDRRAAAGGGSSRPGRRRTETNPDAGRIGYAIANTSTAISPSQKFGTERPSSATVLAAHSDAVRRRTAAMMPAPMPMSAAMTIAKTASCSVTGSAWPMVSATGRPVREERPRSPVSALPT